MNEISKIKPIFCEYCKKKFKDEETYMVHLVFGHEAHNCPRCGTHRFSKTTMDLSDSFDRRKGYIKRMGRYYARFETSYTCPTCDFKETSNQVSDRVKERFSVK